MAQQLLNALVLGSILLLFSLGLSLAWGTLDVLNLSHGAIFILGGYLGYAISKNHDLPFVVTLLIAMVGSGLAAAFLELIAFGEIRRRITNKKQAELSVLVASLGASIAFNQIIANRTQNLSFSPSPRLFTVHSYHMLGIQITNIEIIILAVTLVVGSALGYWIQTSRVGRAARGLAYSASTAELMGVNVRMLGLRIMFMSGALAGLAGYLLAFHIAGENTDTGGTYMLSAFAILVLGGVGSVLGATIAAYVIAIAETMVIAYGPSGYANGIAFVLIFVMLLVRPQGIVARVKSERA